MGAALSKCLGHIARKCMISLRMQTVACWHASICAVPSIPGRARRRSGPAVGRQGQTGRELVWAQLHEMPDQKYRFVAWRCAVAMRALQLLR